jgi:type IV pilus assembly protein PilB
MQVSYKGIGCPDCNNTGYSGRTAVFEILLLDKHIQDLVAKQASMEELRAYTELNNMRLLREEVLDLVNKGETTIDEAVRLLYTVD